MKRNIKLSAILSVALSLSMLDAHAVWNTNSIGDDGNPHTEGNAGANEHHAKLKSATKLVLRNDTNSIISSIQIKDPDGKVHYSNNLNCATESFCEISAPGLKLNKDLDAFFFDSKNKLVSVYDFSSVPDSSQYEYIYASNLSLGLYIYSLLEVIDKAMTFERLSHAFGANSEKYSPFELLGGYYQQQIDSGKSSNQVLNSIDNVIKHNGVLMLNSSLLKNSHLLLSSNQGRMVGSSATKSPFCSSGMKTAVGFFEAVAKGPFAGIGIITKMITAAQYSACPSSTPDYTQQFRQINERLSELRDQMNAISDQIGALSVQASLIQITNVTNEMDRDTNSMETALNLYYSFLRNQPDRSGRYHTTLQSYVAANGGINRVMNSNLWTSLNNLYATSNQLRTSVQDLESTRPNLRRELDTFCRVNSSTANPVDNIAGSIMRRRIDCNYYVLRSYVRYTSIATAAQQALQDMFNSLIGAGGASNFQYQNDQARLNSDFGTFLQSMEAGFGSSRSFIHLINGLDSRLISRIEAVGCIHRYRDSNGQNISEPYILDWHGGTSPYVEVMCPGDDQNTMFRSRYQYRSGTTNYFNPRNVMGVLVPNEFFSSTRNNNQFQHSGDVSHSSGSNDETILWYRLIAPQNTRVYSTNLTSITGITDIRLNPHLFQLNSNGGVWNIMTPINHNIGAVNVYENRTNSSFLRIRNGLVSQEREYNSFIRFTDEAGLSWVWSIVSKYSRSFHGIWGANVSEGFQQQCMTLDCQATPSSLAVRFGLTSYSWRASPAGLLDSSYIMTINGEAIPFSR
ncbi:hypothetical protein [Aquella oligotrophica]|uniref:Uncharacterized protein n=1 Tax=Aquella oligotrophica TaxID=2067065 RepID=A0A2I7N8N8_9NEIS|nr:hypothetical protein [Aquella oligotrophica]AUR52823.1 hypothetical protein CUN60_11130 [Aquella oligotrophica]